MRLNKFIALSGITSRRKADDLIQRGKVSVNGNVCSELGVRIEPEQDEITVNGITLGKLAKRQYYVLNKPKGYICARKSQFGDKLVTELFPINTLSTVGRLDKHTTGLLIATDDGELVNKLTQPSSKCEKEYLIKVQGQISDEQIKKLREGVEIEVENRENTYTHFAKPKKLEVIKRIPQRSVLLMTIEEGKKRQIRLMMKAIGFPRIDLKRTRIGTLTLGDLELGKCRKLTKEEVDSLKNT